MALSRAELIDEALGRVGAAAVGLAPSVTADPLVLTYETTFSNLMSIYPWSFGYTWQQLVEEAGQAPPHWDHAYKLPTDMIGPPGTVWKDPANDVKLKLYELAKDHIFTDALTVWVQYFIERGPQFWPGYFRELFVLVLCSKYAISEREDRVLAKHFEEAAFGPLSLRGQGGQFAIAKARDAQGDPSPVLDMEHNELSLARFSGSGHGRVKW